MILFGMKGPLMRNAAVIGAAMCMLVAAEARATDVLSDHGMDEISAAGTETTNPFLMPGIQKGVVSSPAASTETIVEQGANKSNALLPNAIAGTETNTNPFLMPGIQKGADATPGSITATIVENGENKSNALLTNAMNLMSSNPNMDINSRIQEHLDGASSLTTSLMQQAASRFPN